MAHLPYSIRSRSVEGMDHERMYRPSSPATSSGQLDSTIRSACQLDVWALSLSPYPLLPYSGWLKSVGSDLVHGIKWVYIDSRLRADTERAHGFDLRLYTPLKVMRPCLNLKPTALRLTHPSCPPTILSCSAFAATSNPTKGCAVLDFPMHQTCESFSARLRSADSIWRQLAAHGTRMDFRLDFYALELLPCTLSSCRRATPLSWPCATKKRIDTRWLRFLRPDPAW